MRYKILFNIVLAVFVIVVLIFAATQVQDIFLGFVVGGLAAVYALNVYATVKRFLNQ